MSKPTTLPRWAETTGGTPASNIIEPNTGQKDTGYVTVAESPGGKGDVPASGELNWFKRLVYKWCEWVSSFAAGLELDNTFSGDNTFTGTLTVPDPLTATEAVNLRALRSWFGGILVSHWTTRTLPAGAFIDVTWVPELSLFVALGSGVCATSPDGITWTARTCAGGSYAVWASSLNLLVGCSDANYVTSPDGITWTTRSMPVSDHYSLAWSPELELFVAAGWAHFYTSPDGINWTERTRPAGASSTYCIAWSPELALFVIPGNYGDSGCTSPDGINWTLSSALPDLLTPLVWSPELGLFVLGAYNDGGVYTSPNGVDWTHRDIGATTVYLRGMAWSPELGMFVGIQSNTGRVFNSLDGITWTLKATILTGCQGIAWSPALSLFAAVGNEASISKCATSMPN